MSVIEKLNFLFGSGLFLILLELIIGIEMGFDFVLIGSILVISSLLGMLVQSLPVAVGAAVILSVLYVMFGRQYVKKKLHVHVTKTNTDALIGQIAIVTEAIDAHDPGKVKLNDEIWRATAEKPLAPRAKVIVTGVSGVSLKVEQYR